MSLRRFTNSDPLSPEWKDIIKKYNISTQLAIDLRNDAKEENKIIGMRLDEREEKVVEREYGRKPLYIKLKVSNWLLGGVPFDQQNLAKSFNGIVKPDDKLQTPETKNPSSVPDRLQIAARPITIQEIQQGLDTGVFELAKDLMSVDPTLLAVRPVPGVKNNPLETKVVAGIHISPGLGQSMEQTGTVYIGKEIKKPDYWTNEMGNFTESIKQEYPAQYKVGNAPFQDYLVYMLPQEDKAQPCLMVDKDNDGFMHTMSLDNYDKAPPEAKEILNTFNKSGKKKMTEAINVYETYLMKRDNPSMDDFNISEAVEEKILKYNFEAFGAGTAIECYFVNKINQAAKSQATKPMQHSFENNNKWKLSDLNGLVLWIDPDGQPTVTALEAEHINYLKEYGKNQAFYVNPRWDMSMNKWGSVVENQINNKVMPEQETLLNFLITSNKNNHLLGENTLNNAIELARHFGIDANNMRIEILDQIAKQFNRLDRNENNAISMSYIKSAYRNLKKQIEYSSPDLSKQVKTSLDNALIRAKNAYLSYVEDVINSNIKSTEMLKESVVSKNKIQATADSTIDSSKRLKQ